ncbi:MAG: GNAT family N-acetyltransferase [Caulobacteraceae bacterium]
MSQALIRPAKPEDAAPLSQLSQVTFRETFLEGFAIPYPPQDMAAFVEASYSLPATAARLADPAQANWVAERDGRLLAYANAGPCHLPHPDARPEHGELYRIYVLREAQGLGLGAKLLQLSMDWLEQTFEGPLWLGVWSGNVKAQRLYAAHGFAKAGEYEFPVGAWRDHEFIFRRG